MAFAITLSSARVGHVASCPEVDPVGCADMALADHRHDVDITFANATLAGTFGLGRGLAIHAELPVDARFLGVGYTTLDGAPFDPPYGDIHHRDETLSGLGDPRLSLQWDHAYDRRWQLGVRAGVTLPVGDTTDNPDPLAEQSLPHQHMQIGSGTVDPIVGLVAAWTPGTSRKRWGVFGRLIARLPIRDSAKGYRGGAQVDAALGPGYRFGQRGFAFAQLGVNHTGQEYWDGQPNENASRDAVRLLFGGHLRLGASVRLGPVIQIEVASRAIGGRFDQSVIGTLTLTYTRAPPRGAGATL